MNEAFTRVTKEHATKLCEAALEGVAARRDADWKHAISKFRKRLGRRWFKRWRKSWSQEDIELAIKRDFGLNPDLNYWRPEGAANSIMRLIQFSDTDDIYITASEMQDLAR